MAQAGEILHDKINLQQVVETKSIWPPHERRFLSESSPRQDKLGLIVAL